MRSRPRAAPGMFLAIIFLLLATASSTGCITSSIPDSAIIPEQIVPEQIFPVATAGATAADPVTGTWNGFRITAGGRSSDTTPSLRSEVARVRLNIYPSLDFEYTTNYTIRNGSLIPTGKGNFVVKANVTEMERKYFRYDADSDTLKWESQDSVIEFRRNDHAFTHDQLVEYNSLMKSLVDGQVEGGAVPSPVPTQEIAYIRSEGFTYDPGEGTIYQVNGEIGIESGRYDSVGIVLRYPDKDYYEYEVGSMGGANFTKRDFKIVLNERVKNMNPLFFIRLDRTEYPAVKTNQTGEYTTYTAYTNSTGT